MQTITKQIFNKSTWRVHSSAKAHHVKIWTGDPYPEDFHNLLGTDLSNGTSTIKFSQRCDHFFVRYEPNCGKMLSRNV